MDNNPKNPRPSTPDIFVKISSSADNFVVTVPCFLHPKDEERLYDVIFDFLKTCKRTEDFLDEMEKEAKEREQFFIDNPDLRR